MGIDMTAFLVLRSRSDSSNLYRLAHPLLLPEPCACYGRIASARVAS
jgi:hypothetical protein